MNEQILILIKDIKVELKEIRAGQKGTASEIKEMKSEIYEMRSEIKEMRSDIEVLKSEQASMKVAVLETNEAIKRLETSQTKQDQIIKLLSARSIEHEAAIKELQLKTS